MIPRHIGSVLVVCAVVVLGSASSVDAQDTLELAEQELDELAERAQRGVGELEQCDDSFDQVTTERPDEDGSTIDWLAYGKLIGQWYLACKALEAGDPAPALMLAFREIVKKIPPMPVGPNAVDPAAHLRTKVRETRSLIERLGGLWNTMLGRYTAEQEAVGEHSKEPETGA